MASISEEPVNEARVMLVWKAACWTLKALCAAWWFCQSCPCAKYLCCSD